MRVLVCGGRDYADLERFYSILNGHHAVAPIDVVISGMARGADSMALMWADENQVQVAPFPADWKAHGKSAGPRRNQQMLDEGKPDLVIAFPGGRGTDDMLRRAEAAGIKIWRITN